MTTATQNILIVRSFLEDLLSSDDSSDEENMVLLCTVYKVENAKISKVHDFFEKTVPEMRDSDFKSHFRLERGTVEILTQKIAHQIVSIDIPVPKQILIVLWVLATPDSYRSVSDRFHVSKSSVYRCLRRCVTAIFELSPELIQWPRGARLLEVKAGFFAKAGFPGVVGAIDGTHIPIPAPTKHPASYINRKDFHSVQLQAVCDHKLRFTNAFTGMAGSVHDARVYRLSPLHSDILNGTIPFQGDTHLIGDAAYPLSSQMLTPYRNTGNLSVVQSRYNYKQSSTRITVERSFAHLKGRFRRLKYFPSSDLEFLVTAVIACCALHNMCIDNEDPFFDFTPDPHLISQGISVAPARTQPGPAKRDALASTL